MSTEPIQPEHADAVAPAAVEATESPLVPEPDAPTPASKTETSSGIPPLPPRIDGGEDLDNVLGEVSRIFGQADGHSAPLAALAEDTINEHVADLSSAARAEPTERPVTPKQDAPLNSASDLFRSVPPTPEPAAPTPEPEAVHSDPPQDSESETSEAPQADIAPTTPVAASPALDPPTTVPVATVEELPPEIAETPVSTPAHEVPISRVRPAVVVRLVGVATGAFEFLRQTNDRLPQRAKVAAGLLAAVLLGWVGASVLARSSGAQTITAHPAPTAESESEVSSAEAATEKAKITALEEQLEKAKHDGEVAQHERDQARQRLDQSSVLLRTEQQSSTAQRARDEAARKQATEAFQIAEDRLQLMELRAYDAQLGRVRDCWQRRPGLAAVLLEDSQGCLPKLRDFAWGYFYGRSKNDRATWRGTAPANAVAWSPDGTLVASAGQDGAIALRDAISGKPIATLPAHTGGVLGLAFSEQGAWLASAGNDCTVKLWNVAARRLEATFFGHLGAVLSVAISPDASALVSGGDDGTVKFWDVASRLAVATRWGHPRNREPDSPADPTRFVRAVAFSPDGSLVASGGYQVVRIWDSQGLEQATLAVSDGAVSALAFSPDGKTLAAGSEGSISLRDVDSLLLRSGPQTVEAPVNALAFSPDGAWLAAAVGERGLIFNRIPRPSDEPQKKIRANANIEPSSYDLAHSHPLAGHNGLVTGIGFAPNAQQLATSGADGTLRLWDPRGEIVDKSRPDAILRDVPRAGALAYSPDSRCLAVGTSDSIRLWDIGNAVEMARLTNRSGDIKRLVFSPDGIHLASAGSDWPILIWTVRGQQVELALNGHTAKVNSLAYAADGKTFISASDDGTVRLWNTANGQPLATLTGHTGPVLSTAFSPDTKLAASGGSDRAIRMWNVERRQIVATLTGQTGPVVSLTFSPDGRFLISAEGRHTPPLEAKVSVAHRPLRLWRVPEGKELLAFGPAELDACDVAFSPDSKTLAVSGPAGVTLWDPRTGELRATLQPMPTTDAQLSFRDPARRAAWPIAFSPDGRSLAAAGNAAPSIWIAAPLTAVADERTASSP